MATPFDVKTKNKNRTIRVKVDDYELRKLLATFGRMDDIAKNDMKKIANDLAERAARFVTSYAYNAPNPAQADAVMKSLKINRSDKAPNFTMGGNRTGLPEVVQRLVLLSLVQNLVLTPTSNFHHVADVKGVVIVGGLSLLLWNVFNQLLCENGYKAMRK
jgi:hypothetical protein